MEWTGAAVAGVAGYSAGVPGPLCGQENRLQTGQRGLDVAGELVFRRGSWDVARATLAAASLTDQVAELAVDEEVGDDDVAIMFKEQSAEIERFISRHILEVLGQAASFFLLG